MRVGILGSDVGAYATAAFLKRLLPSSEIVMFSKGLTERPSFSSPWIRNDKKGRLCVMKLGRDILEMGESEFVVSKVNSTISLVGTNGVVDHFPSFKTVVKNLHAIAFEPFRRRSIGNGDVSVSAFLEQRFGKSFSQRYANMITMSMIGQENAELVSVHTLLPKMARSAASHRSVLLGPLWAMVGGHHDRQTSYYTNVMDHLWQKLASGGKYVSMAPRLDLSLFYDRLEDHVVSTCRLEKSEVEKIEGKNISTLDGSCHSLDVLVTSLRPDRLVALTHSQAQVPTEAVARLSEYKTMYSNRLSCAIGMGDSVQINQSTGEKIIPQSCMFKVESGVVVDILSDQVGGDGEEIPACKIGSNQALLELNNWRRQQALDIQFVGKWYYTPTGSVTDMVADADRLAFLISKRYDGFPYKRIENEFSSDYISRSDRSLDLKYEDELHGSTRLVL